MTSLMEAGPTALATAAPLLRLRDVQKRFADHAPVLAGMSLDIAAGSFVSLLGASGCGRSTLLRLIAGLARPTAGTLTNHARRIGYVFQEPTLMPWASALDNVLLPLRIARREKIAARRAATEALAAVGLEDCIGVCPANSPAA